MLFNVVHDFESVRGRSLVAQDHGQLGVGNDHSSVKARLQAALPHVRPDLLDDLEAGGPGGAGDLGQGGAQLYLLVKIDVTPGAGGAVDGGQALAKGAPLARSIPFGHFEREEKGLGSDSTENFD